MFNKRINLDEMMKLVIGLDKKGLQFTAHTMLGGIQIICNDWDAICHCGSYGHEQGLIEVAGSIVKIDNDDVEGCLTADEILARL